MKILSILFMVMIMAEFDANSLNHYEFEDVKVQYGTYCQDAYLMIINNESGEIYSEITINEGYLESFIYLGELSSNQFVLVMEVFNPSTDSYGYSLLVFSKYGNLLETIRIDNYPLNFYNHHYTLIIEYDEGYKYLNTDLELTDELINMNMMKDSGFIQYQGQAYINNSIVDSIIIEKPGIYDLRIIDGNYIYQETIIIEADLDIFGQKYKDGYKDQVKIVSNARLMVNDHEFESGKFLIKNGDSLIQVFGENGYIKTINIKIYPSISYYDGFDQFDLIESSQIDFPIRLYSKVESIRINGEIYQGEIINKTGELKIELFENEQVIDELSITIVSRIEGVIDQEIYSKVLLYAFGDVLLNEEKIEGYHSIDKPGKYKVKVYNDGLLVKEVTFYVSNPIQVEIKSIIPYGFLLISVLGLLIVIFKK